MLKRILTTLVAISLTPLPVEAGNTIEDHRILALAVDNHVTLRVNPVDCWQQNAYGWYNWEKEELVICQTGRVRAGEMVAWSEEDLDTLRHEAHHLVQDCSHGVIGDYDTGTYFQGSDFTSFINNSMNAREQRRIRDSYDDMPQYIVRMELEAFSVAQDVDASTIATVLTRTCNGK